MKKKKKELSGKLSPENFLLKLNNGKLELMLSPESRSNVKLANELLKKSSIVIYLNHTSKKDPIVGVTLALSELTNANRFLGPAGMRHYDFKRDPFGALFLRSLKAFNIHAIPVVQTDDIESYGNKHREKMLKKLKKKTKKMLGKTGSVYGIWPEGTRNKFDSTLMRARRGIGHLEKYDSKGNLYYVPVAILYPKHTDEPELVVGNPRKLEKIITANRKLPDNSKERAQFIADLLMLELAKIMPLEFRGVYNNFKI